MNEEFTIMLMVIGFMLLIATIVVIPVGILEYISSCKQADIYNEKYQANYTCSDFFWAGDQINTQTQIIQLEQ